MTVLILFVSIIIFLFSSKREIKSLTTCLKNGVEYQRRVRKEAFLRKLVTAKFTQAGIAELIMRRDTDRAAGMLSTISFSVFPAENLRSFFTRLSGTLIFMFAVDNYDR